MAFDWAAFITEQALQVATTWSDVVAGGIWEYDEAISETWEQRSFPIAVFKIHSVEPADWGLINEAYEPIVEWHYLTKENASGTGTAATMATVRTKLEALRAAFTSKVWTTCTFLEASMDWSESHPANAIWDNKNVPFLGGVLSARFVCGETAF